MKKTIGIIGAMKVEIASLAQKLENREDVQISGITFHTGMLYDKRVVLAVCGVGKVFAAICTQTMIMKFDVGVIVNTGVAGGLLPTLGICASVIADKVVQHDMDTSAVGDPVGLISGINLIYIDCDPQVVKVLEESVKVQNYSEDFRTGTIASGDTFIATDEQRMKIALDFKATACDMECAPIGQVCYVNNVPFAGLRVISDTIGGNAELDYFSFVKVAAERAQSVILEFINRYDI